MCLARLRLQSSRIFCERARAVFESREPNVKTECETVESSQALRACEARVTIGALRLNDRRYANVKGTVSSVAHARDGASSLESVG